MAQEEFEQFLVAAASKRREDFHRVSEQAEKAVYERARAREILDRTVLLEVEDVLRQAGDDISPLTEDLISNQIPIQTVIELGDLADEFWQSVAHRSVHDIEGIVSSIHMTLLRATRTNRCLYHGLYSTLYPSFSP